MLKGLIVSLFSLALMAAGTAWAQEEKKPSPAEGFTIHVMAPHKFEDGTVHGPYHHYCKGISPSNNMR